MILQTGRESGSSAYSIIGGAWGTVPELLFERKELIPALQHLLISCRSPIAMGKAKGTQDNIHEILWIV